MIDAVIISVALSGIKRSTGLTPAIRRLPNKDLRNLVRVYLETGEWVSKLYWKSGDVCIRGCPMNVSFEVLLTRFRCSALL